MRLLLALILVHNIVTSYVQTQVVPSSGTSGRKVVTDVVQRVEKVLGSTNKLLERTAWVESKHGRDRNTYRPGYHGGIWQVDAIGFAETKNTASHPNLQKAYGVIKKGFGIDWPKVKWVDLRKPLYSGIAARLIYRNFPAPIPSDVGGQARYWKTNYNSRIGKGTIYKFAKDVMLYNTDKTADFSTVGNKINGNKLFLKKAAQCHTLDTSGKHKIGPNLYSICAGRKAGLAPGFSSTNAMKSSGITWTSITLYKFLQNPKKMVPGTKMVFAGIKKDRELFDMIAYLCQS